MLLVRMQARDSEDRALDGGNTRSWNLLSQYHVFEQAHQPTIRGSPFTYHRETE